jgi:hypothetical protein
MRIAIGAALLLVATATFAQRVPLGIGIHGVGGGKQTQSDDALADLPKAGDLAAMGKRDGDDKLTCEQLQEEFQSSMSAMASAQDPSQIASAEENVAKMSEMQQRMMENRPGVAKAMAQSMNPFGAKKRAGKQQADMEAQAAELKKMMSGGGAQAATNGPSIGGGMSMAVMARSQRINELGDRKKCDFLKAMPQGAASVPPGVAPPAKSR